MVALPAGVGGHKGTVPTMRKHIITGTAALCIAVIAAGDCCAQTVENRPRGKNTASPNDYTVSYGSRERRPRSYNAYYNTARINGYTVSPFIVTGPGTAQPIILGPVRPYSDEEYARIVISALEAGRVAPTTARRETESVVRSFKNDDGLTEYEIGEAVVTDALERGVLLLENGEQVKLRGVRVPSDRDTNDFTRLFAREAITLLRESAQGQRVYLMFDEPLRNGDGTILATVYLADGTQLNKLVLARGFGRVDPDDFLPTSDLTSVKTAEDAARSAKVGIWSRTP